jgi:hypothetical protein
MPATELIVLERLIGGHRRVLDRRAFVFGGLAALAAPLAAGGKQAGKART